MIMPSGYALALSRMSLLDPAMVDIENPLVAGYRIIGWNILPDELWKPKEGLQMVKAIEIAARLNFPAMKARLLDIRGT